LSNFKNSKLKQILLRVSLFLLASFFNLNQINSAYAESAKEIDVGVDEALKRFCKEMPGGKGFLNRSKGILVFPQVLKAGFGIGGEYGEGALRINNKTVDYYSTIAASFGFQFGAQAKTVLLAFMEKKALADFRNSAGWKAGVDGSVALLTVGVGDSLDTVSVKKPIIAFVFGQKGLMYNLTLEGSKFTKLKK
jgi:lipid-binding SYLF domain-containing protein